jgi:hypothetical protein
VNAQYIIVATSNKLFGVLVPKVEPCILFNVIGAISKINILIWLETIFANTMIIVSQLNIKPPYIEGLTFYQHPMVLVLE